MGLKASKQRKFDQEVGKMLEKHFGAPLGDSKGLKCIKRDYNTVYRATVANEI
jgi:hypothetical protein